MNVCARRTHWSRGAFGAPGLSAALAGAALLAAAGACAENLAPNPYRVAAAPFGELPDGRTWGATSAIYPAADGRHVWVAERCGANSCVDSDVDPVLLFRPDGTLVRSFGKGLFAWPHGMFVDGEGNVWVADATGYRPVPDGYGHVVYKFSPEGELLMTLGERGVPGNGPKRFNKPSDVLVAPDGHVFVADGHDYGGNNRVVKLAPDGSFVMAWGSSGKENGQFHDVHALAMDSRGRLFVGDRGNSRIQIFTQDGEHLETWYQFGRPSGLYIDENDVLYVADSESGRVEDATGTPRNPGFKRGIRIGSARDGFVTAFIPDPVPDQDQSGTSGAEGVAVMANGDVYGAEVGPRQVVRYVER